MSTPTSDRLLMHLQYNPEKSTLQLAHILHAPYWEIAFVLQRLEIERQVKIVRHTGQPVILNDQMVEDSEALYALTGFNPLAEFGMAIRSRRELLGMDLQQASDLLGLTGQTLSRIEGGKSRPSPEVLQRMERDLAFTQDELFVLAGVWPPDIIPTAGILQVARSLSVQASQSKGEN